MEDPYSSFPLAPLRLILFNGLFLPYRDCEAQNSVFAISRVGSAIPLAGPRLGPGGCPSLLAACGTATSGGRQGFLSVLGQEFGGGMQKSDAL